MDGGGKHEEKSTDPLQVANVQRVVLSWTRRTPRPRPIRECATGAVHVLLLLWRVTGLGSRGRLRVRPRYVGVLRVLWPLGVVVFAQSLLTHDGRMSGYVCSRLVVRGHLEVILVLMRVKQVI